MRSTHVNGVKIAYELHGKGEPVLFVHGFPLSRRLWQHLVGPLQDRYTLIMPDFRGMGDSDATAAATMADYADDLAGLLDAIGENRRVVVVGLSMGGYIAFEFFRRHGERVRALVLADTKADADTPEAAKGRLETAEKVKAGGSAVVAEAMTPKLFAKSADKALIEEWRGVMAATKPEGVVAALSALASRPDSTGTLGQIRVPTLIVVGEEDGITPPASSKAMHDGILGSKLEIISGAGHMTPVEKPREFVAAMRSFLDSLE